MKFALLFFLAVVIASAQTNPPAPGGTNQIFMLAKRVEKIRADCIQNRRIISGKILKVLPDGLVVDSGYTNLMRFPLNQSWLVPGTAVAERAANFIERNQPDSVCVGLVFLGDLPKTPGIKPKLYDYVNLEGFPAGQYTYTSVGDLHRTVRKFSTKLATAVQWNFIETQRQNAPPK